MNISAPVLPPYLPSAPTSPAPFQFRLQPSLSTSEAWGFGFSGLLLWLGPAPAMHAALGPQAIWVWLPAMIVGTLLNLQVKRLGSHWPAMAGGTPNYTTRLLTNYPHLATYAAIGYFFSWAAVPLINAIILTDLITVNLRSLGWGCPELLLKVGFTLLSFVVAFSGTRALGILHLFFMVPAIGLLLAFCGQGIGWLAVSPDSPGFWPEDWGVFNVAQLTEWAKWFFISVYAVCACETASSFVADSHRPNLTLRCLSVTAGLIPMIYLGGSWVLMRLSTHMATTAIRMGDVETSSNAFLNLLSAATPFWGGAAPLLVTFLIVSGALLSGATGFANAPRVLYQLAMDGHVSPVFAVTSQRGVLGPALVATVVLALVGVVWGDVSRVVMVTGTGYFASIIATHFGLWVRRGEPQVRWPQLSVLFLGVELVALVVGGLAWDWLDFLVGLLAPLAIMGVDQLVRRSPLPWCQPQWWEHRYQPQTLNQDKQDFVGLQVVMLLVLVCGTAIIFWYERGWLVAAPEDVVTNLFVVLLLTIAYVAIAIACWTSLSEVVAVTEAKEQAELARKAAEQAEAQLRAQAEQLTKALTTLKQAQVQLVQSEKMSSLGQLVAGVAHEINNPINFIHGNLNHAAEYSHTLIDLVNLYQQHYPEPPVPIQTALDDADLDFLTTDMQKLLQSMRVGTERIREIVLSLRTFSRLDESEVKTVNLHEGIDSTLLILQNRLKAKPEHRGIQVIRDYGQVPLIECYPGPLNQVFMNLLANGIDALEDAIALQQSTALVSQPTAVAVVAGGGCLSQPREATVAAAFPPNGVPTIRIQTDVLLDRNWLRVRIGDNGIGMDEATRSRLFDPFFTTKPVGKGTGLGLSISYQIVTELHGGKLYCYSTPGAGAEFVVELPIQQGC